MICRLRLVASAGRMQGGIVGEFGMDMYTLLYLKWITNKVLLYSTKNSAQCYMAAWMGEKFSGDQIHVYVWLSPFTFLLTFTTFLIDYTQ